MGFPESVDGWILGSNDDRSGWHFISASPSGWHRLAYRLIGDNGNRLTYRIFHQVCLYTTSHIMRGYSARYNIYIGDGSTYMDIKNGNDIWNSGPNGASASQPARVHYYTNVGNYGSNSGIHSYKYTDPYGASGNINYSVVDITFTKTNNGIVRFVLNYTTGPGNSNAGVPGALKLNLPGGGVDINTGRPLPPPYTPPSIWLNPNDYTRIGKLEESDYTVHYSLNRGTDNIYWTRAQLFNYYNKRFMWYQQYGRTTTNSGYFDSYRLRKGNGFSDGQRYRLACSTYDGRNEPWSPDNPEAGGNGLEVRTYRIPVIKNIKISDNVFSPQDNPRISWTTNSRTWLNNESNFVTKMSTANYTKNVNSNPQNNGNDGGVYENNVSETINENDINKFFTNSQRSVNELNGNITLHRISNNLYDITNSVSFKVQYQPIKSPNSAIITDSKGTSIGNKTIIIQDIPNMEVDWTYPVYSGAAGVVDGYILKIYKDNSYADSSKVGNDIIINVARNSSNGNAKINTKTQLKRGVMNYLEIIPFYNKPDGSGKIIGTQTLRTVLVKPISIIDTPKIEYPINNSIWNNKDFRILLELPNDDDKVELGLTDDEYIYQDIELKITPNNKPAIIYTYKNNPDIFSANKITYKRKIAIKPSNILDFPDVDAYKLEIRVQKNYYVISGELSYSHWSKPVTIKNISVLDQDLNKDDYIEAGQTNYIIDKCNKSYSTYPIIEKNLINVVDINNKIIGTLYDQLFDLIQAIINGVNSYCTYDKIDIKFSIIEDEFKSIVETITSKSIDNSKHGRNYIKILTDYLKSIK